MALTGAIHSGRCYMSPADAVDAYYSHAAPVISAGDPAQLVQFVNDFGTWTIQHWTITASGRTLDYSTAAPVPSFPPCDPSEKFLDGQTLGWGIASAMVAVAALMLVRRGARSG